ncbi:MAG: Zn-dependent oligopeptidase [Proteobacteria bacterium]|nr:Zn-dependent oligopeptidase [Pseudomonadota bacterium]
MKLGIPSLAAAIVASSIAVISTTACLSSGPAVSAATPAPIAGTGIDWSLSPEQITTGCTAEIRKTRVRIESILDRMSRRAMRSAVVAERSERTADHSSDRCSSGRCRDGLTAFAGLHAIETAVADMNDALIAHTLFASVVVDRAVRRASRTCREAVASFNVELSANPALYQLARAARARASDPTDRQLATIYIEAGRRAGAGLDPASRTRAKQWLNRLNKLQLAYMQALGEKPTTIEISADEAASLPASMVRTLQTSRNGYIVPVAYGTVQRFLANQASHGARKRYFTAFYNRGGPANVERLERALALRDQLSHLLGFKNWAAYRLDNKMAKTPERALALLEQISATLLPTARAEIQVLADMKSASGDSTPFAAWDYAYYEERLTRTRYGADEATIREYFPADKFIPAVLDLFGTLFGVTFQPISPANAWAPGVLEFSITDSASGTSLGWFFLDLHPRPGKALHFSHYRLRAGRVLPDGGYQLPIAAMIGNGPAAEPGKPPLLGHKDVIIFFHEFGHLIHDTLSTARYATLYGTSVRGDFVEAPSQMLENWAWQPSILRRVSSHITTGDALPDQLIETMIARKRISTGAFWTRQAFFGVYDIMVHSSGHSIDTTQLWIDLTSKLTALPPALDTIPQASFAGFMGGYDAGYYGYLWSKVFAQDMFTEFMRAGLDNPAVGRRYRREILEPGGSREPDVLLKNFLGRAVRLDAFYDDLGLGNRDSEAR